ncbi:MAG TPA: metal ABC transporter substrate-binding protein [Leptospiraceae bacterium]|nr:metal ABC transporter substrate-binding protein [Leptospiraceae bacterium]HMW04344.1 metal ABC transporter substrate-binding protein [Leptospiraceae bacterium]HMX31086.1 metal ABC transporter substrate-binding protein [Leptospiraceae bacterium]HMY31902.1 metal ABC transporter substrate-binding protein [Leptospiraceae bacterium]HMZ65260.1 metal ABC transporter substrate-binding protein [Leptospiraceae bacterium]
MIIKLKKFFFLILFYSFTLMAEVNVVTTVTDLKYIAEQVGKDKIKVESMIRGFDDPHFVMTRPDFLVKLNQADVFCQVGLDLEIGWAPLLVQQSRNIKIQKGQNGFCDASVGINILGKPTVQLDRSMGDMHIFGNPHYISDPVNAIQVANNITLAFQRVDPDNNDLYQQNFEEFRERLINLTKEEMKLFKPYFGSKVAVFHDEFMYLANRFRFNANLTLEERPGIPPSSRYLEQVIKNMKANNIKVILISPVNNPQFAEYVASQVSGSVVVTMPTAVGAMPEIKTYEDMIRTGLKKIKEALDKTKTVGGKK